MRFRLPIAMPRAEMTKVAVATRRSTDPQRDAIELFWVCGGLFLLVSNQLFDPVLGIVGVVVFGRRDVSEMPVKPLRVEPVHHPSVASSTSATVRRGPWSGP